MVRDLFGYVYASRPTPFRPLIGLGRRPFGTKVALAIPGHSTIVSQQTNVARTTLQQDNSDAQISIVETIGGPPPGDLRIYDVNPTDSGVGDEVHSYA